MKTAINGVVFTGFPTTKKESSAKIQGLTLLIAFFDKKDFIHKEFIPASQTIKCCILRGSFDLIATVYPVSLARVAQDWKMNAAP